QVVGVASQLGHPGLECVAGPGGLVEEQHEQRLVGKEPRGLAGLELRLQLGGQGQRLLYLLHGPVERLDVVPPRQRRSHPLPPSPPSSCWPAPSPTYSGTARGKDTSGAG